MNDYCSVDEKRIRRYTDISLKFKSFAALALSAAMMFSVAACGTTDSGDAKSDSKAKNTTVGYDVSTIKKDDELAKLAASAKTVKDGELSVGMELSYAPAEFYADSPVADYAISQTDDQLEALGEDVGVTKKAVAIKKGDSDTAKAVQAAMQKLMDDGTYMKILKHWGVESGAVDKAEINPADLG